MLAEADVLRISRHPSMAQGEDVLVKGGDPGYGAAMHRVISVLLFLVSALVTSVSAFADIPATPVMTVYKFNGSLTVPYYSVESFQRQGPKKPAGTLAQGTSVIPCLVIRDGAPLTDKNGTPYVGFDIVVDSRTATHASTAKFRRVTAQRSAMRVPNHHCGANVKYVTSIRRLYALDKAPFFFYTADERISLGGGSKKSSTLDTIVRAFHDSPQCAHVNRKLIGRRGRLASAWSQFVAKHQGTWTRGELERAKNLDYVMRTAIYEGHLDRGCNAYGACERNIIALTIRNRGRGSGDYQAVSSRVSQYNIWDEFITQVSGLTSCFLNDAGGETKPGRMYAQNVKDVERILYGDEGDLRKIFPGTPVHDLVTLKHYYHAPAMRKCFPQYPRMEYMSGAVARKGNDFALIANTRIKVGRKVAGGYVFREYEMEYAKDRDIARAVDNYSGFVVDGRKVSLNKSRRCTPYGVSPGCRGGKANRYRARPRWLRAGRAAKIRCRVHDRGRDCQGQGRKTKTVVGGPCDREMTPVAGVR